jgi:hypothetical protein
VLRRLRSPEFAITLGFLAVLAGVPIAQVVIEMGRGQRVQFTDVFRYVPTMANLRRYETALENQSWVRQRVRPVAQQVLFATLNDTGPKGLLGADQWMFYRPGVRYLVDGDRPDVPQTAVQPRTGWEYLEPRPPAGRQQVALQAILEYQRQLRQRSIELLVLPVPEKSSVYPDRLTRRAGGTQFRSPSEAFLGELRKAGVEFIDLFTLYREARAKAGNTPQGDGLYLATDTHWSPQGARLAAEALAARIRERGWLPDARRKYQSAVVAVERRGDVVEMLQAPAIARYFSLQTADCSQITDKIVGLLAPREGDREGTFANTHLKDTPLEPTVLLLGDSFARIYQLPEPRSLGDVSAKGQREISSTKRLLPGSAGLPSLLAAALQSPVDYIVSDGGAATEVRQRLSVNSEILENKKVLVWEFTERDLGLGRQGWASVPLPPKL